MKGLYKKHFIDRKSFAKAKQKVDKILTIIILGLYIAFIQWYQTNNYGNMVIIDHAGDNVPS